MTGHDVRSGGVALVVATALLAGWWFLAASPAGAMHAYLAAWLLAAAFPLGALPWVMLIDLAGEPRWTAGLAKPLRRMLCAAPAAGLLLVPILVMPLAMFHRTAGAFASPFAHWWLAPTPYVVRSVVYFLIWSALSMIFARPPEPARSARRRGVAAAGLGVHLVIVTLAAVDWVMLTESGFSSTIFGLLFLSSQMLIALSAAVLLAGEAWRRQAGGQIAALLVLACAVWLFIAFIQYLVIWSADRPDQAVWYLHRDADAGTTVEWIGFLGGFVVPVAILGVAGWRRRPGAVAIVALLLLVVHWLGTFWLVTPSFRHHFGLAGTELSGSLALTGVLLAVLLLGGAARRRFTAPGHE